MLLLSSSEIRCTAQDLEWCQIWESIQKTLHRLLLPHLACKQNCGEVLLPGRLPAEQKECLALYSLAPFCPGLNMWHQSQINTYPLSKFHMSKFWSRSLIKWFKYLTPLKARGRKKASAGQTEFAVTVMKTEWGESKSSVKLGLLLLLRAGEEKADYCLCLFPAHVTSSRLWDKQHGSDAVAILLLPQHPAALFSCVLFQCIKLPQCLTNFWGSNMLRLVIFGKLRTLCPVLCHSVLHFL